MQDRYTIGSFTVIDHGSYLELGNESGSLIVESWNVLARFVQDALRVIPAQNFFTRDEIETARKLYFNIPE